MRHSAASRRRTLALIGLLATGDAAATAATLADCDRAESSTTLLAQPGHADARAIWLDARTLRWPGKRDDASLRLDFTDGQQSVLLALVDAALPGNPTSRLPWTGPGAERRVPDDRADEVAGWLAGNLLLVEVDATGAVVDATRVQHAAALDDRYAQAAATLQFGVHVGHDGTVFRLWAPTASAVAVCVYADDASAATALLAMHADPDSGRWTATVDAVDRGYYTYLVDVFVPGTGFVRNRVTDPYSLSLGTDSQRSWIGDLDDPATKPAGWDAAPPPRALAQNTDAILYELHVRDFSAADTTVPAAHRGKYLAFADGDSAGMRHLRLLAGAGVTDVHLLPVYDFGSVPERGCVTPDPGAAGGELAWQAAVAAVREQDCFNWGYDPLHYGAAEGSYATDPGDGGGRVREFRTMVQALHAAGLRVGMDVVYNHTFASGQNPRAVLDRIVPGYYHRLDRDGAVALSTCCDNTATENAMMAKLMIDTAATWARDYRIDSFRFDLMGHQPRAAMERLQQAVDAAAGRHLLLIGEGWNFGEVADGARFVQASQRSLGGSGIATFSDRMRDAVRGGGCCDDAAALAGAQGWANGLHYAANGSAPATDAAAPARAADLVRVGSAGTLADFAFANHDGQLRRAAAIDYAGQPAGYASSPAEVVNYVENHDNMTLYDIHAMKLPAATPASERARVQLLSLATVALAQGVAYFHAGGEILRSKSLDRNSFNSGDAFNRIDWSLQDNGFGSGLPPAADNEASWDAMRPVLADPSVPPSPADIRWTRDAFLDLVRIRRDSPLLRLGDAAAVQRRLRIVPAGAQQDGTVVGAWLDGSGLPGSTQRTLVWFINAGTDAADIAVPELVGQALRLHPLQAATDAADARPRTDARYDAATGRFRIPPRTVVVWVAD